MFCMQANTITVEITSKPGHLIISTTERIGSSQAQLWTTYNTKLECIETRTIHFYLSRREFLNAQYAKKI